MNSIIDINKNSNGFILQLFDKTFKENENFCTKCAIELIKLTGIKISDNPSTDELIECKKELDKRHYKIRLERCNFGISGISLLYSNEFVAGYNLKRIPYENDEEVGFRIVAKPVVERD